MIELVCNHSNICHYTQQAQGWSAAGNGGGGDDDDDDDDDEDEDEGDDAMNKENMEQVTA